MYEHEFPVSVSEYVGRREICVAIYRFQISLNTYMGGLLELSSLTFPEASFLSSACLADLWNMRLSVSKCNVAPELSRAVRKPWKEFYLPAVFELLLVLEAFRIEDHRPPY